MSTLAWEQGGVINASYSAGGLGAPYGVYPTETVHIQVDKVPIPPPPDGWAVHVHVGLALVKAESAEIGIMSATKVGLGPDVTFDPWETAAYGQILGFTVGADVTNGAMRGWWYWQLWQW
ncbi:hypothetical protein [Streptomyces sp. NRRL F-5123]|uniref:hypothetical protein n=1 Tax=Streptomyces sp. NRRL F-5123 TaxID=1463856 RepID=UPI000B2FCEBE|nr:hypothetical protein [Streptomyces sp. NRRL F-5123]